MRPDFHVATAVTQTAMVLDAAGLGRAGADDGARSVDLVADLNTRVHLGFRGPYIH